MNVSFKQTKHVQKTGESFYQQLTLVATIQKCQKFYLQYVTARAGRGVTGVTGATHRVPTPS